MFKERLHNAWTMEKEISSTKVAIERLSAKATYKNPWEHNKTVETNTAAVMDLINKLYVSIDRLSFEMAYIEECINLLDDPLQRGILMTRYMAGQTIRETAKIYNYSPEAVKKITRKAIRTIERKLGENVPKSTH